MYFFESGDGWLSDKSKSIYYWNRVAETEWAVNDRDRWWLAVINRAAPPCWSRPKICTPEAPPCFLLKWHIYTRILA